MPIKHGVYTTEQATGVSSPIVAATGIPFVIGASPVHVADSPAEVGKPVLCTSYAEFVEKLGYSDTWSNYNLCEFAYSHFQLFGCQPAIFVNLLDKETMKESVTAADKTVTNHQVKLELEAIPSSIVVKAAGGAGEAYVLDTDYSVFASGEYVVIELLSGTHYSEASINVAYNKVTPASVTDNVVAAAMGDIDLCMPLLGVIPDLIVSPKYSKASSVAAAMATKAAGINGMFKAKAIVDIDSSASGADVYSEVAAVKASLSLTDKNEIVCWPKVKLGDKTFYMSTQIAGLIATVDAGNGNPYESPSNKGLKMDSLVVEAGTAVILTKAQADIVNGAGVVTALNFLSSGWVAWGNYTGAFPGSSDVKDTFIPVSRMFGWVANTLIQTFWSKLDKPMNRRLIDSILDTANIWLNGLVGAGYLLGARAEMLDSENPLTDLMQGIVKIHIYMTPPSPAQEIDFTLEYDADYVTESLS